MIVSSFLVRGLWSRVKRRKINKLASQQMIDFLAIQETKIDIISESLCHNLWDVDSCD